MVSFSDLFTKRSLFLVLGASSTCSCVAFVSGGQVFSLYTISLFLTMLLLAFEGRRPISVTSVKAANYYYLWTLIAILSSLFGMIYFMGDQVWMDASWSYVPKLLLYYFFFYLLLSCKSGKVYSDVILRGLIIGIIINAAWAIADASIYYLSGHSITNEIFSSYIKATHARYDMLSLIKGGVIRSGGLNADPANIGMFASILASYSLYSRKYWLYVLALLSILASVSITAFVSTIIITLVYLLSTRQNFAKGVLFIAVLLLGASYLSLKSNDVSGQMITALSDRLDQKTESDMSDKDNKRAMYWVNFLPAVASTPTSLFLGTGYCTASHAYIEGGYVNTKEPYDPEQTYFSTFFDIGLVGTWIFVAMHIYILLLAYKKRIEDNYLMLFAGMEGIMISFMGYHYTLYSVSMLFLIVGIVLSSHNIKFIKKK